MTASLHLPAILSVRVVRVRLIISLLFYIVCLNAQTTYSVLDFGAKPDGILRTDGAMAGGSAVLTSISGSFSSADIGKYIQVVGSGRGGTSRSDGVMTAGSSTLSSVSGIFSSGDVGRGIIVLNAGPGGTNLITTIAAVAAANSLTLNAAAGTTLSGASYAYGAMTLEAVIQKCTEPDLGDVERCRLRADYQCHVRLRDR